MATSTNILSRQLTLSTSTIHLILYALFFCSGCSALIYQVMWQRMLFTAFGVDLVSVTIVVSVFMFGLGIGGLLGGMLADRMPTRLLAAYILIELCIVVFGFFSPDLIDLLGGILFSSNQFLTGVTSFVILAIPTLLMGATFPMLVTHVNQTRNNIGDSVGGLYFANTLGGAMGAYMAGFILLHSTDMAGAINCAVVLNLAVAFTAYVMFKEEL